MNADPSNSVIRISKEEATSSHVDDLLKRQMSLRGEPGVTRDRSRKWYYQTWLILMVVGILGALTAWALIEPYFSDSLYFQGTITEIDPKAEPPIPNERDERALNFFRYTVGAITIKNEKIFLLSGTKEIRPDGSLHVIDLEDLQVGDTVGTYSEYFPGYLQEGFAAALFVDRAPKPLSVAEDKMTLDQLQRRDSAASTLFFPIVAGIIGLFIGAADGIICRLPRRALLCGFVGVVVGIVGGFICSIAASVVYAPLSHLADKSSEGSGALSTLGFVIQMFGRSLAWALAGVAMGLGQGIALRSKRLLIYGLLGGVVGGLLGGLLFDPIDLLLLGSERPNGMWSRLAGLVVIGATVGALIGVVELLARDAWLRMTQGPLTGKEFLLFKDIMNIGSSPRSDIYLFNDTQVTGDHAVIRAIGDECEIEARHDTHPVLLNNQTVRRARLRHGDHVTIGRTVFVFQRRKG